MPALIALVLFATAAARAEPPSAEARCVRVQNVSFPVGDRPSEEQKAALKGCDAEDLYYGIEGRADPVKARLCAYLQMDAHEDLVFGGESILMMIYATGVGAKRNLEVALRLACQVDGAPAELEARLDHLEEIRHQKSNPVTFDLCDDITSGFMMGHCAAHDQRFAKAKRQRRWKGRLEKWAPADRAAFGRLRAAGDAFFRARSEGEVDLSGTARGMLAIQEEESLEDGFVALVDALEAGKVATATSADYQAADKTLNAVYGEVLKTDPAEMGTVTKADIKKAERAWIRYRDEWVRFARGKYPAVSSEAIKTWLTRERTRQLQGDDQEP